MSVPELLSTPSSSTLAELAWRIGLALSAINFVVLAVALTKLNARGGRNSSLVFVVLAFVAYNNLINLGRSWMASDQVGVATFLIVLHGGVLAAGLAWLAKRDTNWTLRSAVRSGRSPVKDPT